MKRLTSKHCSDSPDMPLKRICLAVVGGTPTTDTNPSDQCHPCTILNFHLLSSYEWINPIKKPAFAGLVPEKGIEPPQYCYYQILSLARLPVPPPGPVDEIKIADCGF